MTAKERFLHTCQVIGQKVPTITAGFCLQKYAYCIRKAEHFESKLKLLDEPGHFHQHVYQMKYKYQEVWGRAAQQYREDARDWHADFVALITSDLDYVAHTC